MAGMQGRVVVEDIAGRCLEGNPLHDPPGRRTPVYLPPSYDTHPERRYPTVYCLAGFSGAGVSYLNYQCWSPTLPERVDALIVQGHLPEAIVVMPDAMTRFGGSQYVNSTATGAYQDYIADEVVAHVDARFRTLASPRSRAVVGKSSGGYGALVLGMQRSDVFGAVGCHSGDMYFEYAYLPDIPKAVAAIAPHGDLARWLVHFESVPRKQGGDFAAMNVVAMAAAYSPNPGARPLGFDLPFDPATGRFREDVWERWLQRDPLRMLDHCEDALRGLRGLFIDVGSRDEYFLHLGARLFHQALDDLGIAHRYEEFPDGHRDTSYRYAVSLPYLVSCLERDPAAGGATEEVAPG